MNGPIYRPRVNVSSGARHQKAHQTKRLTDTWVNHSSDLEARDVCPVSRSFANNEKTRAANVADVQSTWQAANRFASESH